jgi:trehalose-6-phosphatase
MTNYRVCAFSNNCGHKRFDPVAAQALNNLCEKFNAVVVFASTRSTDHSNKNKEQLFNLFADAGFDTRHIHDDWSATYRGGEKASQIRAYLQQHPDIKNGS